MPYGELAKIIVPAGFSNVNVDEAPHTDKRHDVGYTVTDDTGREYVYVRFGGVVAQYDACRITVAADPFTTVVVATNVNEALLGVYFHATSTAALDYGWLIRKGKAEVKTATVTAATAFGLGASATDGTLTELVSTAQTTQAEAQRMMAAQHLPVRALTDTASGRSTVMLG